MLLGLILGSMVAGIFFLFGFFALYPVVDTIKDDIRAYGTYKRNKSYGHDFSLKDHGFEIKDIFTFLSYSIICIAIGSLIIWASYDYTQDHVLCDFKGGTLNDSNQCVQEIKL